MADQKTYRINNFDLQHFSQEISRFFESQDYEVQAVASPGGVMIQTRAKDFIKKLSVALTVTATVQADNVLIQTGSAKWGMNAVNAVAATIIFWPLLALPVYTSLKQKQLIDDTWSLVERYMVSIGATPAMSTGFAPQPAPVQPQKPAVADVACPSCGKPTRSEAKFCDHCGKPMEAVCTKCGSALRSGAKFCDNCGTAVG
jgi:hypothetical protein